MLRLFLCSLLLATGLPGCASAQNSDSANLPPAPIGKIEPGQAAEPGKVDLPRLPSISPDGKWIVFTWRGDLWKVSSDGGHAERLTNHPGVDLRSRWSPDGTRIAFNSERNGYRNIYMMNRDGRNLQQITNIDRPCLLSGFGTDEQGNEVVTFEGWIEGDVYRSCRVYMCSTDGGSIVRLHDAFGAYPRMNADGKRILFTRGGSQWSRRHYRGPDDRDVWLYNRADGSFKQLTEWEGNDGWACWAGPNSIVYLSDREMGCVNVYRMDLAKGERSVQRLTNASEDDVQGIDVSADGTKAVVAIWDTLYTLDLTDQNPKLLALNITATEDDGDNFEIKSVSHEVSEASLSPDGQVMAYVAYGEVFVRNLEEKSPTRRVTYSHDREKHIAWSPDGLKLYFVSDRDGSESIYAATVALTRGEVKEEFEKATNPAEEEENEEKDVTSNGVDPALVDTTTNGAKPIPEDTATNGTDPVPANTNGTTTQPTSNNVSTNGESEAKDTTTTKPADDDKDADSKKKDEKEPELPKELQPDRWHDAIRFNIEPVVVTSNNDRAPSPSPDGTMLAFRRSQGNLMVLHLNGDENETQELVKGWDPDIGWQWSPDSKYIAYHQHDLDFNSEIWIVSVDGSTAPANITRHPDNDFSPRWSADGKILCFISERIDEEFDVWRVYLDKDLEALTAKEREDYYADAVKAAKKRKPLEVKAPEEKEAREDEAKDKKKDKEETKQDEPKQLALEDAYLRLQRVTRLNGDEVGLMITPAADRLVFNSGTDEAGLYSVKWDGSDRKKLSGRVDVQQMDLTGSKLVFVKGGQAGTVSPSGGKTEFVEIDAKIRIDLREQASQKFREMAREVGENFYHPTLKGLDWDTLSEKYHTLARQTRTASEFNHVAMRLLGELNGSHLGVYSRDPRSPNAQSQGRMGTLHKRVADGFEVTRVIPQSPADVGPMALKPGDVITAIDTEPFGTADTIESRLTGRVGIETLLTVRRKMEDGEFKDLNLLITPMASHVLDDLKYRDWRRRKAELVSNWSDGRIGYIHVEAMGQASLDIFERDLYAAAGGKDGLIIDVRNNGGGWTADRLLSSIMVRQHAYTLPRGAYSEETGHYPQDRLFIQRYTLPINMLCNEKSFSNAEIVSHAFKTLDRGTLVGQQTYGGVISTGGTTLIDGTWVRLPFRGWFLPDGTDMENNGAIPDILVPQTPEAESRDDDEQLKAAVEDLLKRLK